MDDSSITKGGVIDGERLHGEQDLETSNTEFCARQHDAYANNERSPLVSVEAASASVSTNKPWESTFKSASDLKQSNATCSDDPKPTPEVISDKLNRLYFELLLNKSKLANLATKYRLFQEAIRKATDTAQAMQVVIEKIHDDLEAGTITIEWIAKWVKNLLFQW